MLRSRSGAGKTAQKRRRRQTKRQNRARFSVSKNALSKTRQAFTQQVGAHSAGRTRHRREGV